MHGPKSSLKRAWYRLTTGARLARNEWSAPYWEERGGERIVPCRRCPKLDAAKGVCTVPFGSPLRKCVVAATEAHLRGTRGERVLELGFARRSYGKKIVELSGGSWTGSGRGSAAGRRGLEKAGRAAATPATPTSTDSKTRAEARRPRIKPWLPATPGCCARARWPGSGRALDARAGVRRPRSLQPPGQRP